MTYAADTKVKPENTRAEIEATLRRYGAKNFGYFGETARVIVVFEAEERRIRFDVPMPSDPKARNFDRLTRSRWRGLLLCIKAKLESVESGIESFEDAFLAHVVLPDGSTVGANMGPELKAIYSSGEMRPLLPPPTRKAAP